MKDNNPPWCPGYDWSHITVTLSRSFDESQLPSEIHEESALISRTAESRLN